MLFVWGKLFRAELGREFRFPEERVITEDGFRVCLVLLESRTVAVSNRRLYRYVGHEDSTAHSMAYELDEKKLTDRIEGALDLYRLFMTEGMQRTAYGCMAGAFRCLVETMVYGLYWKDGNHRVVNRFLRGLIRQIWRELGWKAVPVLARAAAKQFDFAVLKRIRSRLFWSSRRYRRRVILKKR